AAELNPQTFNANLPAGQPQWYANIGAVGAGWLTPNVDGAALTINANGSDGVITVTEGSKVVTVQGDNTDGSAVNHGIVVNPGGAENITANIHGLIEVEDANQNVNQSSDGLRFTTKDGASVNIAVNVTETGQITSHWDD